MALQKIYIVRHGESEGNANKDVYGLVPTELIKLTDLGIAQSKDIGASLSSKIDVNSTTFFVSTFLRAQQTYDNMLSKFDDDSAKVVADRKIDSDQIVEVNSYSHPSYERFMELKKDLSSQEFYYFKHPEGENCEEAYDRLSKFMDQTIDAYEKDRSLGDSAVLVMHGLSISLLIKYLLKFDIEGYRSLHYPVNCECLHFYLDDSGNFKTDDKLPSSKLAM